MVQNIYSARKEKLIIKALRKIKENIFQILFTFLNFLMVQNIYGARKRKLTIKALRKIKENTFQLLLPFLTS